MVEIQAPPPLPKSQPSFGRRHSTIIKLLGVGALVLVLLIPLMMITGMLSDRLSRRNEAVADITSSWGREQNVIGPVLGVPFQYKFKAVKETPGQDGKLERRLFHCFEFVLKRNSQHRPDNILYPPPRRSDVGHRFIPPRKSIAQHARDHH